MADGSSVITVHVDGVGKAPISIVTSRGWFDGGGTSVRFDTLPQDIVLHTCDAAQSSSCAGAVVIQAVDADLVAGTANALFTSPGGSNTGGTDGGTGGTDGGTGGTDGGTGGTDGGTGGNTTPVYEVKVAAGTVRILADHDEALVTALVTADGVPLVGRTVNFEALSGSITASAQTDASGVAKATFTSTASSGSITVTAVDGVTGIFGQASVSLPSFDVKLTAPAMVATANGQQTTITAQVTANGEAVKGRNVAFSAPGATVTPATAITDVNGFATATIASTGPSAKLVATAADVATGTAKQADIAPVVYAIALAADPFAVTAAAQTTTLRATLTADGQPVQGRTLAFSSTSPLGVVTAAPGGTSATGVATAQFSATDLAGNITFTAKDVVSGASTVIPATLPVFALSLSATKAVPIAAGESTQVTATLTADGQPVSNRSITFSAPGGNVVAAPQALGPKGTVTVTVTSTAPGGVITVAAVEAVSARTASVDVPLPIWALAFDPAKMVANATGAKADVAVTLTADGTPFQGRTIDFTASDGQVLASGATSAAGAATTSVTSTASGGSIVVTAKDRVSAKAVQTTIAVPVYAVALSTSTAATANGQTTRLSATVTADAKVVGSRNVRFDVGGVTVATVATGPDGVAAYDYATAGAATAFSVTATDVVSTVSATANVAKSVYSVTVVAGASNVAADGTATTAFTATITADGQPAGQRAVSVTAPGAVVAPPTTDASGVVKGTFGWDTKNGSATVTVTDTASNQPASATVTVPAAGQVKFVSQTYPVQGVIGSGYQETNHLTFQVLDAAGKPYPAGLTVTLTHPALWGSYVGTTASCANPNPLNPDSQWICTASATTDATGTVIVPLRSGSIAGMASVTAAATAGGTTASVAHGVPFIGAKVAGGHFSVDCKGAVTGSKNIPAFTKHDCTYSVYDGPDSIVTCTAVFADRFDNVLGVPATATFATEAGAAGPPSTSPEYDPTKLANEQTGLGVARSFVSVYGGVLPHRISAGERFGGEPTVTTAPDRCGVTVRGPRDGLVTVIAMANGEEGFVDVNGNGVYDVGEPFIDLGEPFVDENDNGKWDPGEPFFDTNHNNKYDGPNGRWDANTVIWAETRILYTGEAEHLTPSAPVAVVGPAGGVTTQAVDLAFTDHNLNELGSPTFAITSDNSAVASVAADGPTIDRWGYGIDGLGVDFTQLYCAAQAEDGPAWSACSNACVTAPCYVVTNVGGCTDIANRTGCDNFSSGTHVRTKVTGACSADLGTGVLATATTGGAFRIFDVPVSCTACTSGMTACGAKCVDMLSDAQNCGQCGTTCTGAQTCQAGLCVAPGTTTSPYFVSVTVGETRIAADGAAKTTVNALVTTNGTPASGRSVQFAIQPGGVGTLVGPTTVATNASGIASITFQSDAGGGSAVVEATDVATAQTGAVTIGMPMLGQVNAVAQQYQVQGVRSSGYQEVNTLTFQLLDSSGQPYPAGLAVSFSHQSLNGSYLGAAPSCSNAIPSICTASGITDASGQVKVLLTSGQLAGVTSVTATAQAGGSGVVSGTAKNLAIIGAKANGAHVTLDCTPKNVPAFTDDDCTYSHYAGRGNVVTCTASFADRFNNVLGLSTLATFASEAGSAGPPTSTPQYDSAKDPGSQTALGTAVDFINVTGGTLPWNVQPIAGEPSTPLNRCVGKGGDGSSNPRDGLVTVIVMANGEEGFVDQNGNGQYDFGEPFIDLGEPFVDANDNGIWDPGEPFIDIDGNGVYDGPNGVWDANTVIWTETRILYTGFADASLSTFNPTTAFALAGTPGATTKTYGVAFVDGNLNALSSNEGYPAPVTLTGAVTAQYVSTPSTADTLGMGFTQQYCDQPTLAASSKCSNVCASSPCYVVTSVGAYARGTHGSVAVTGACTAPAVGGPLDNPDTVNVTTTLFGVPATISVSGQCTK